MSAPDKRRLAAQLLIPAQAVGCLCAMLLVLCLALRQTLMNENHYAGQLDRSGYFDFLQQEILTTCSGYAAQIGTGTAPLKEAITVEAVRAGVLHRADAIWNGSSADNTDPFGGLITRYQDTIAPEPPVDDGYRILQYNCQQEWQSAVATPYSAALGTVLQYRGLVSVVLYLAALLLVGCVVLQFLLADRWLTLGCSLLRMADCTLASGLLLAVGLAFTTGYRSWTAAAGVWQTFWTGWFGAFPLAVTADAAWVVLLLSLLSWETCNLYRAAKRKRKQKQQKQRLA